jgi:hypothetical protein
MTIITLNLPDSDYHGQRVEYIGKSLGSMRLRHVSTANGTQFPAFTDELVIWTTDFDMEAFIDGYIDCALWSDCMPVDRCEVCGEPIEYRAVGRWEHGDPPAAHGNDEHDAVRDENLEIGGGGHLEIRPGARDKLAVDCREFVAFNMHDLMLYCEQMGPWEGTDDRGYGIDPPEARAGHDFWLTRRGHGTGFWDRGLGKLGDRLSEAAKVYGDDDYPFDCGDGTADV